ncbi:MAG: GNAT family N-acetyltransferase [Spirochaetales bacterium]|nr:GNAT family N-acetyltransferase [Spirochaetales bacterium]
MKLRVYDIYTDETIYMNTDEEYFEICEFLNTLSAKDPFMLWESGRMNYWRYTIHANKDTNDRFFRDNVHIRRDKNRKILGLCISEYGGNDLFIEVLPGYHGIYPGIFHWIETTWAVTRTAVEIDVFRGDTEKIHLLEKQGFTFMSHFENKRTYDPGQIDLNYTLEDGFTIQNFSTTLDYSGRVALVQSAFDTTGYTEHNLKSLMASPDYIDEYNLSVISPDSKQVAYCIGWHDQAKKHHGYIEPVGTHPAYRRRGFAKALNKECFRRMKANGITTVDIASRAEPDVSNFLYDALYPQTKREVHKYGKKVE